MRVATLLRRLCVPLDGERVTLYRRSIKLCDGNTARTKRYDFALVDDDDAARVFENGGNVPGQKFFVFAQAYDERATTAPRSHQKAPPFSSDSYNGLPAPHAPPNTAYR